VVREHVDAAGTGKRESYRFTVRKQRDGGECVLIDRKRSVEDEDYAALSYTGDGDRLRAAARMFQRATRVLVALNRQLLEGRVPIARDAFALNQWRQRGYIR
jgi:hypothetical protein